MNNEEEYWEPDRTRPSTVHHYPEHWYSVRAWTGEYDVQFEVFEMTTRNDDGSGIEWGERGASCGPTFCDDMDKSERAFTGYVKWDECSDWDMQGDGGMHHHCCREQAVRIGIMLGICYDLAPQLMPQHAGNFAPSPAPEQ